LYIYVVIGQFYSTVEQNEEPQTKDTPFYMKRPNCSYRNMNKNRSDVYGLSSLMPCILRHNQRFLKFIGHIWDIFNRRVPWQTTKKHVQCIYRINYTLFWAWSWFWYSYRSNILYL